MVGFDVSGWLVDVCSLVGIPVDDTPVGWFEVIGWPVVNCLVVGCTVEGLPVVGIPVLGACVEGTAVGADVTHK